MPWWAKGRVRKMITKALWHTLCFSNFGSYSYSIGMRTPSRLAAAINFRSVVGWLIMALFALIAFRSAANAQTATKRPELLPAFSFLGVDGKPVSNASLVQGQPTVVVYFDPGCDHCQRQAQWIRAAESQFGKTQFVWVSTADLVEVRAFGPKYLAGASLKHHLAKDAKYQFDALFGYSVAPTILAFDGAGRFKHAWENEVAADEIAKVLR